MNMEEVEQKALAEILGVVQQQKLSPTTRLAELTEIIMRHRIAILAEAVAKNTNLVVPYGPFAGMRCVADYSCSGSSAVPRMLGSYEAELHDTILELASRGYERIVNIGCGEGYYAVGLARLMPTAHVYALDPEPTARIMCNAAAELNGVAERVTVMGKCTPAMLQALAHPKTLIFCDCEGAELELLDPVAIPTLAQCDILVEMHDFLQADTSAMLETRFRGTHSIQVIRQVPRDPRAFPILQLLSDLDQMVSLCEFRPGRTPWGLFLAKG